MKMSCPAPRSSHCCSAHGITVILHGGPANAKLHVKGMHAFVLLPYTVVLFYRFRKKELERRTILLVVVLGHVF